MRRTTRSAYLCVALTLGILVLASCGGGISGAGGDSGSPPPSSPSTPTMIVVSGDQQYTYAGGSLLYPLEVEVTLGNAGAGSLQVTFSSSSGVQIYPAQTTTGPTGYARALVQLPDVSFSSFTISASVNGGNTVTFTEFTGPRLVQVFGDADGINGAVAGNGTFYAQGSGAQPISGPGGTVFAPDGTVNAYLGSILHKINLPDPGTISEGGSENIATAVSPNQNVYFYDPLLVYVIVLDPQLNIVNFLDMGARNPNAGLFDFDSFFAIAPNGNLYWNTGQSAVSIYDPTGAKIGEVVTQPGSVTSVFGLVATQTNNFVLLLPDSTGTGSLLNEFNVQTGLIHSLPLPYSVGLARDSAGNYAVLEDASGPVVARYDEQYNLLTLVTLNTTTQLSGGFYVDDSNNSYFTNGGAVYKFDSSGNISWVTGAASSYMPAPVHVNGVGGDSGHGRRSCLWNCVPARVASSGAEFLLWRTLPEAVPNRWASLGAESPGRAVFRRIRDADHAGRVRFIWEFASQSEFSPDSAAQRHRNHLGRHQVCGRRRPTSDPPN